jgi:hypothetical protein
MTSLLSEPLATHGTSGSDLKDAWFVTAFTSSSFCIANAGRQPRDLVGPFLTTCAGDNVVSSPAAEFVRRLAYQISASMTFGTLPPPCSLWKESPNTIIRKMTGHPSEELERYKHLDMTFANQSVERIGSRISRQIATNLATPPKITTPAKKRRAQMPPFIDVSGGGTGLEPAIRLLMFSHSHSSDSSFLNMLAPRFLSFKQNLWMLFSDG